MRTQAARLLLLLALLAGAGPAAAAQAGFLVARSRGFDRSARPFGTQATYTASTAQGFQLEFWPGPERLAERRAFFGVAAGIDRVDARIDYPPDSPQFDGSTTRMARWFVALRVRRALWAGDGRALRADLGVGLANAGCDCTGELDFGDGHLLGSVGLAAETALSGPIGLMLRVELAEAILDDRFGFPFYPGASVQLGLTAWSR